MKVLECKYFVGHDGCYYQITRYEVDLEFHRFTEHFLGCYNKLNGIKNVYMSRFEISKEVKDRYDVILCGKFVENNSPDFDIPYVKGTMLEKDVERIRFELGMIPERYCRSGITFERYYTEIQEKRIRKKKSLENKKIKQLNPLDPLSVTLKELLSYQEERA